MDNNEGREEQVRMLQETSAYSYTTKYIEGLIENACELIQIMIRAGYTKQEMSDILGLGKEKYGDKERILLEEMIKGTVSPNDSLGQIQKKMGKIKKLSRQSWGIALNRLISNGDIGNV